MRLGAQGAWLFPLVSYSEDHEGALVYTSTYSFGKMAAGLGHHCADLPPGRVLLGMGLLLTDLWPLAAILRPPDHPEAGLALAAIGSGLGWLLTALERLTGWAICP